MSTIDQTGQGGKPTNKPSDDAKGEDAVAAAPTIEDAAHTDEGSEPTVEDASTRNGGDESAPRSGEAFRAHGEQHTLEPMHGLTALALLRAMIEEHGLKARFEGVLLTLDGAIRRAGRERATGDNDEAPVSAQRSAEGEDDEPTTARTLPPNLSTLALRLNDGAMLVSLEDAEDRDLSGREVIRCMVLTDEEAEHALEVADEALSDAAATIIGGLPKGAS